MLLDVADLQVSGAEELQAFSNSLRWHNELELYDAKHVKLTYPSDECWANTLSSRIYILWRFMFIFGNIIFETSPG